ncbi:MAG: transglutaminase-like domain-containing protein, partial [Myxococcota bacterium]
MIRRLAEFLTILLAASGLAHGNSEVPTTTAPERTFDFIYRAEVGPIEAGLGPVHVFIPLPRESAHQTVHSREVHASIPGSAQREDRYGNLFWHGTIAESTGEAIGIEIRSRITRHVDRVDGSAPGGDIPALSPETPERELFLMPNQRVIVGHSILKPILEEIGANLERGDRSSFARALYDWTVDNVEYKKVGSGWGNGDSFWACSKRYGNCTDFHSLFISLARTEGIPARFEMGFPVPVDRESGRVEGYHCWVEFHLDGVGWFPIDASEASKHPDRRDFFYGAHPADRIHFTTGRDLRLGEDHRDQPL